MWYSGVWHSAGIPLELENHENKRWYWTWRVRFAVSGGAMFWGYDYTLHLDKGHCKDREVNYI